MNKNKKIMIIAIVLTAIAAAGVIACILIFGGEKKVSEIKETATTLNTVETTTDDPNKDKVKSFLTGEYVGQKIGERRPVALMYNNIIDAIPQSGISSADVVYEAPVEGAITRLMAVFENYDALKKMGSVRSCRIYYAYLALEWDAMYGHFGQSKYALDFLKSDSIDNIGALNAESYFYRTSDRSAPHNCFTSGENINKAINKLNYRKKYKKNHTGHFKFAEPGQTVEISGNKKANKVEIGYQINKPWFEYNSSDCLYYRFQYGGKHIDDQNNKQLSYTNIIIQSVNAVLYPDGKSLDMTLSGKGKGWFVTKGKAQKITWKKENQSSGITRYYNADGEEITVNTGKTFICLVQSEYLDNVKISK